MGKPRRPRHCAPARGAIAARQARKLGANGWRSTAATLAAEEIEAVVVGLAAGAWEYTELKTPPPEEERRAPLTAATILGEDRRRRSAFERRGDRCRSLTRAHARNDAGQSVLPTISPTSPDIAARHTWRSPSSAALRWSPGDWFVPVRRAGNSAGTEADRNRVHGGEAGAQARRAGREGTLLRQRRNLHQARAGHGRHEVRHVRRGRRARRNGGDRAAASCRSMSSGLFGATTNMPSGTAMKPVTCGQSFREIHRDHQHGRRGRLVLADVLSYARRFDPAVVIDAATLTGACVIALGHTATGIIRNDEGAGAAKCSLRANAQANQGGHFRCGTTTRS